MKEQWKDIEGYKGLYQVSDHGRIKRLERTIKTRNRWGDMERTFPEKILSPPLQYGYPRVGLWKNGTQIHYVVHRLVAKAFIPNPQNKPNINHIDANKENNHVSNLEWCTQKENINHSLKLGLQDFKRGEEATNSKLTREDILDIRNAYRIDGILQEDISNAYNISISHVSNIINRKMWAHV